ncbi:hypothetical protein [Aquisalimonas sp.]|uniref:hypothetical protein n=1 Tax=Aquisalimonas sp. TaxID=1872621 RepID=UPI0025BA359A|nr:hypothetical protein [Aquisalimonas sp.]
MRNFRYHVRLGERRTTVSLDIMLSAYLALQLGHAPESAPAHEAVRAWLQQRLDLDNDPYRYGVSHWLAHQVMEVIVDKTLSSAYDQWFLQQWEQKR